MTVSESFIRECFTHWQLVVEGRRYDEWCLNHAEELEEEDYARENEMDTVLWCWSCKYGDCEDHM